MLLIMPYQTQEYETNTNDSRGQPDSIDTDAEMPRPSISAASYFISTKEKDYIQ